MLNTNILGRVKNFININMEIWKLNKLISTNPEDTNSLRILGSIYYHLHENRIAIRIYERVLKLDPRDGVSRIFLSYLYYELGSIEKAIDELNESIDLRPNDSFAYFLLGNCYSRIGLSKEAIKAYDMSILLGFDVYRIHIEFANRFYDMNRKEKALIEYKAAHGMSLRNTGIINKIKKIESEILADKTEKTEN